MITYPCANCQRDLEVDDDLGGQRVKCPHCGNVEVAPPARAAGSTARARPAKAGAGGPAAKGSGTGEGTGPAGEPIERELRRVHPVLFRSRPVRGALLVLLVLSGVGLAIASRTSAGLAPYGWTAYVGLGLSAVGLCWIGVWKVLSMATTLVVTNRRTILHRGLLSRATNEMRHDRVQDIHVIQSFPQRVLRVGTLGIDGAGGDGVELMVHDLPDPVGLRELIDSQRGLGA